MITWNTPTNTLKKKLKSPVPGLSAKGSCQPREWLNLLKDAKILELWTADFQLAPGGLRQALYLLVLTITTNLLIYLTFLLRENHTKINLVEFSSGASAHGVAGSQKCCVRKWEIFLPFSPTLSYTFWSRNSCNFQIREDSPTESHFSLFSDFILSLLWAFFQKKELLSCGERHSYLSSKQLRFSLFCRLLSLYWSILPKERFFFLMKRDSTLSPSELRFSLFRVFAP